jgi:hypothetical protein
MSQKGKDDLLELIAKDLGYIEWSNWFGNNITKGA